MRKLMIASYLFFNVAAIGCHSAPSIVVRQDALKTVAEARYTLVVKREGYDARNVVVERFGDDMVTVHGDALGKYGQILTIPGVDKDDSAVVSLIPVK